MKTLNQANETVGRIADLRIIYVPPMTVAAYHAAGENREEEVTEKMSAFIMAHDLAQEKPDFRRFGFNNPAGDAAGASLGYESWVSIPPEMAVEAPYVKKEFGGGLYAAKMIRFGEFQEWGNLWQWVMTNADYNLDPMPRVEPSDAGADPALEETLDAIHQIAPKSPADIQLDLLVPIVEKGNKLICQSCGMNIDEDSLKGTEADGSLSQDYCSFCYRDGRFTTERTIDEQVEIGLGYSEEYQNARNEEEKEIIRQQTKKYLAGLKRWQG